MKQTIYVLVLLIGLIGCTKEVPPSNEVHLNDETPIGNGDGQQNGPKIEGLCIIGSTGETPDASIQGWGEEGTPYTGGLNTTAVNGRFILYVAANYEYSIVASCYKGTKKYKGTVYGIKAGEQTTVFMALVR